MGTDSPCTAGQILRPCLREASRNLKPEGTAPLCTRSCLTEGNPPPLLINYWRRRQQQLSNNIGLAAVAPAAAAAVHAPFGLNYRHASNRGEAATSAARRQRHARAGKNGNEAAPPPPPSPPSWQPSPPRWLSVRLGPDTGMKFSSKNARLREGREGGRKEMAKTDITLITVGILGRAASAPAGLLCIGLKPSRRGGERVEEWLLPVATKTIHPPGREKREK